MNGFERLCAIMDIEHEEPEVDKPTLIEARLQWAMRVAAYHNRSIDEQAQEDQ